MDFERSTEGAQQALAISQEEAKRLGQNYVGTEHLLLGLLKSGDGPAVSALAQQNVTADRVEELVDRLIGKGNYVFTQAFGFTPRTKPVSYTHLDVYKRQVLSGRDLLSDGGRIFIRTDRRACRGAV